ncbi:vWA domain-containing protein [Marinicella litoralis]|nr:VWA domain-containing protein [Marinicella litoralis]
MSEITWNAFHFLRPHMLWLMIPAAWLLYKWLNNTSRQDGWQQSCDPELLQAMQIKSAGKSTQWTWLYWPITFITVLALAGPAVRQLPVPMVKNQSALVIALDVSKSMLSDDLKPTRLQRAKFKIQDLLAARKDGQTALVVYSGDAFVVTPLTDDTETIVSLLDVLDPSIMPVSGTNTVAALDKATELLSQAGINRGQILMVTDSIDMYKTQDRLEGVSSQGIAIHVLAVGTAEGAPIPTSQGFLKDLRGQIVIPQVDFASLQQAAKIGNGRFSVLSNSPEKDQLYEANPNNNDDDMKDELGGESFIDDGPLLAILLIPMLALLYRRGILMVLCLGFMLNTQPSHALSWNDLWLNQDQQAFKQLESAPSEAFNQAKNQQIKAAAAYKKEDYKTATQLYPESGQSLADYYNRGNALAQSGQFEAAIKSYEQALTYDPDDEDTLYNKKIVEEAMNQQQQQQDQENQENQENQDSEQNEQDQQEQQSQENQESSEQEKQEQEQQAQKDQQAQAADQQENEEQQSEEQQQAEQQENPQDQEEIELTPEEKALDAEEKQAMEQWLRRIKDDPGGLMRRKFLYQYHKRNQDGESYDQQTTEDW